jgi:hypothetical protein
MVDRKRTLNVAWWAPLFIGLIGFSSVSARPEFATYRPVDVVGLLVSGAGLGAAVGLALLQRRTRRFTMGRVVDIQQELDRILADPTADSGGTSGALSTSAVTVDRARLQQLRERLDGLLWRR